MNNTVEFAIKMRDMMSIGLGRLSSTAQSSFTRMSQSAHQMTSRNQILGMSFNELQRKIQQVESTIRTSTIPSQIAEARRELAALQRQSTRHAGNVGGGAGERGSSGGIGIGGIAVGSMLGGAALQAGSAIVGAIGTDISKSFEKEQAITGLTTFLGKQGASDAYKNIRQDADVTPFDTASLLEVNRALISAGANAQEARKDTMNLANAVSAVGGGNDVLSRMAANMQQIKTVGKATAMDIRQFGIAGINIYEMLHRSTGKSIEQIKKMDVTYDDLAKSMAMANATGGIYEGALAAQSQTRGAKYNTIKDKLGNAASDIADSFAPLIDKLLDKGVGFLDGLPKMLEKAQPFIDSISAAIENTFNIIAAGFGHFISFVKWINSGSTAANVFVIVMGALTAGFIAYKLMLGGVALWTGIVTTAQWLWNAALAANPIGIIIVAIGALVGALVVAYKKFEGFRAMIDGVWGVLKDIGSLIKAILTGNDILEVPKLIKRIISGESYTSARDQSLLASKVANKVKEKGKEASPIDTGAALANKNSGAGKDAGDTVTGGGPKIINIHLGKFFETIQFTTLNSGETAQQIENVVTECLARVLYNGSKTA